ncbi:MAG: HD domain-containing protein [Gammaproteobacteria bacterium]|nr:HD domain-containing protein [Gammaproteobacteria bacterium]
MSHSNSKLPIFEDPYLLEEVLERFDIHIARIETYADQNTVMDTKAIDQIRINLNEMFAIASSSDIPPIVEPLYVLNGVYKRISVITPDFTNLLHATIAILERLQDMIKMAIQDGGVDFDTIQLVQRAISPLAHVTDNEKLYSISTTIFNLLVGDFQTDQTEDAGVELFETKPYFNNKVDIPRADVDKSTFSHLRILSETVDARQTHWHGRTEKLLSLALGMNAMAENQVDVYQLEAAVYLHDFALLSLSDIYFSNEALNEKQTQLLQMHTTRGYELALAMPDLNGCAQMIYQHHECVDGTGYPDGIYGDAICHGAKILSICDYFFALTHAQPQQPRRKTILRAVVDINAKSGKTFDQYWVEQFNKVVRAQRLGGFL